MSSADHTLLARERLHCGVTAPRQPLTGLDLFSGHIGIPVTLVYPQGMQVRHMREALVQTLRHYPLIAGRMKKDADGQVYVDCNDAGIDFRVHEHDQPLPAHGPDSDFGSQIKRYFSAVYPWQWVGKDQPLLQVNVHRFRGGGVILCCYGPHSLFDGSAYWQFMSDWSRMARGLEVVTPAFDHQAVIDAAQTKMTPDAPQVRRRNPRFVYKETNIVNTDRQTNLTTILLFFFSFFGLFCTIEVPSLESIYLSPLFFVSTK